MAQLVVMKNVWSVALRGEECVLMNRDTGQTLVGNRSAYDVLQLLIKPRTASDIITRLASLYPEEQTSDIINSVVNTFLWGYRHGILEDAVSPEYEGDERRSVFDPVIGERVSEDTFAHVLLSCHC